MKLNPPKNPNYAGTVCKITSLVSLEGCDNVVGANLFGYQAIVGKDTQIGDMGIVFPAECQLSDEFCSSNNLYRHKELNQDNTKAGYIEDSRRIKAVKFRGHTSSCLFMSSSSLEKFLPENVTLTEGDTFDEIDGQEICRKYEVLMPNGKVKGAAFTPPQKQRFDKIYIPEHIDTENYWKNADKIPRDTNIVVTQKIHGTSIRIGNSLVERKLTWLEKIAKKLGAKIQPTEFAYLFGSKKVIKDPNNPNQIHYYSEDIWTTEGKKLEGMVPEGYVVYAELVGFTPGGKAIQAGYTYGYQPRTCGLYVYRVAHINDKGMMVDLSWQQVKEFCIARGLQTVVEVWSGRHSDFVVENWLNRRFADEGMIACVPLSDAGTVDEGVCIRMEGMVPFLLKAKSPKFFEYETSLLDKEIVDMETSGESA